MVAEASATGVELNGLLLASAQGNVDAFKALYKQTSSRLLSVIRRNVWNASEAEEVLQEVYVKVWRFASSFEPSKSLAMTWITHIARNQAIDHLRRCADRAAHETVVSVPDSDDQPWDAVDPGLQPQEMMESRQAAVEMTASLLQLSRDQRLVLLMAFHQELTQTEIADRLGVPLGTVKSWMRRGLQALKASLDQNQVADDLPLAMPVTTAQVSPQQAPARAPPRGMFHKQRQTAMAW